MLDLAAPIEATEAPEIEEMTRCSSILEIMIFHHRGEIEMAEAQNTEGKYPDGIALTQLAVQARQGEIEEMNSILAKQELTPATAYREVAAVPPTPSGASARLRCDSV